MAVDIREGDVIAGKYRVERVLGEGGMGVVLAAVHLHLDQKVAIKVMQPEMVAHPEIVERFGREARAASKIQGPHVARVHDVGTLESGSPYMVMEYLEGEDLAGVLERRGPLPIEEAVGYLLEACEALAEAHAAGIVHRDLKPPNLFLAKQPGQRSIVKVLDFGISKIKDPQSLALTRTATMMGTPHYMSPEQLTSSRDVDERSDVWALGVILYELVTAKRPYDADTMPEIVARILQNAPPAPSTFLPDAPPGFDEVITRCLRSSATDRYRNVAEFARALEPFADDAHRGSVATIARVLGGPSVAPQGPGSPALPTAIQGGGYIRRVDATAGPRDDTQMSGVTAAAAPVVTKARPRWPWIAAGAGLVLAVGLLTARRWSTPEPPARETPPIAPARATEPPAPQPQQLQPDPPVPSATTAVPSATTAPPVPPSAGPEDVHAVPSAKAKPRPPRNGAAPAPSATNVATSSGTAAQSSKKNPLDMGLK